MVGYGEQVLGPPGGVQPAGQGAAVAGEIVTGVQPVGATASLLTSFW
jgi:hypothetical protein